MSERFLVLCTIAPLVARLIDDLQFTPTEDGSAIKYEGPLSDTLLAVYPKVEGYEVRRLAAAPASAVSAPPPPGPPPAPEPVLQTQGVVGTSNEPGQAIESRTYTDGTQATGPGPLPTESPAQQDAAAAPAPAPAVAPAKASKGKGGKAAA